MPRMTAGVPKDNVYTKALKSFLSNFVPSGDNTDVELRRKPLESGEERSFLQSSSGLDTGEPQERSDGGCSSEAEWVLKGRFQSPAPKQDNQLKQLEFCRAEQQIMGHMFKATVRRCDVSQRPPGHDLISKREEDKL